MIIKYNVIGLMSGTSLDGLDIAFCEFSIGEEWNFKLIHGETVSYDDDWKKILREVSSLSAEKISKADAEYGMYLGKCVKEFCRKYSVSPDFISSHGHTVFHQPENGFTKQIGSGPHIAAASQFNVVCDFRSLDVALGGQGAPLVPIGDKYLFGEAEMCLNLGGIANISFDQNNERIAFDICACNLVLNHYASKLGTEYDKNGDFASGGKVNNDLLNELEKLTYYSKSFPKSLGREDIEKEIFPLIEKFEIDPADKLATFCNHIASQISKANPGMNSTSKILITGGGVFNTYLLKCIKGKVKGEILIPSKEIIGYKEAIIFAFLGVLRMRGEINCLRSVTGAQKDNCGGTICLA